MASVKLVNEDDQSATFALPDGMNVTTKKGDAAYNFYAEKAGLNAPPVAEGMQPPMPVQPEMSNTQDSLSSPAPSGFDAAVVAEPTPAPAPVPESVQAPITPQPVAAPAQPPATAPKSSVPLAEEMGLSPSGPNAPAPLPASAMPMTLPVTTQQTETRRIDSKTDAAMGKALDKKVSAIQSEATAEENLAKARELETQKILEAQELQLQARQAQQASEEAAKQEKLKAYEAIYDEMKNNPIDSGQLWGSMSTGNKVLAAISLGLGAFAAPTTDGKNLALDMLNKAIDRDVDIQKSNMDRMRQIADGKGTAYTRYVDLLKDESAARAAMQIQGLELMKSKAENILTSSKNEVMKAKARQIIADAELGLQMERAKFNQAVDRTTVEDKVIETKKSDLRDLPAAELTRITGLTNAIQYLREFKNLGDESKRNLGFAQGRITAWKGLLGIQSASEADLEQRIIQAVAEKTKVISGAATTDQEAARLAKTLGRLTDNPEAFFKKMDNELAKMEREYDNMYKMNEGKYAMPNRIINTQAQIDKRDKEYTGEK